MFFCCLYFRHGSSSEVICTSFFGQELIGAIKVFIVGCMILLPRGIRSVIQTECLLPYGNDKEVIYSIVLGSVTKQSVNDSSADCFFLLSK